jgi:hypothetical protein
MLETSGGPLATADVGSDPVKDFTYSRLFPQTTVFCFSASNRGRSNQRSDKMEVYRFRFMNKYWYAYALLCDAEDARKWLLDYGYHPTMVGPIEKSGEQDFELKMNSISSNGRSYR